MEELSLDNILSEDQVVGLFSNGPTEEDTPTDTPSTEPPENTEQIEDIKTTEATPEELFGEPESVGSEEEDIKDEKGTASNKGGSSSSFYSSIANALVEDGILQNLDDDQLSKINSAEDFAEVISNQIKNQFDERQKRIDDALNFGIEPTEIQKYERYLDTLEHITDDKLSSEDEAGEHLRKNLIYQDYLNKGYTQERALKMVERSFKAGTDIDDAREALQDNKDFFSNQYNQLIKNAKVESDNYQKEIKKQADKLRNSILEEDKAFGEIAVDKGTRQKVYDCICKPAYTDPETGTKLTAIQKYELENRVDFLKNVGLLYVLTDGFKNIDRLVQDKVKKETKKSLRNLEHTLKGDASIRGGNLTFVNNSGETDPESLFKGWKLSV